MAIMATPKSLGKLAQLASSRHQLAQLRAKPNVDPREIALLEAIIALLSTDLEYETAHNEIDYSPSDIAKDTPENRAIFKSKVENILQNKKTSDVDKLQELQALIKGTNISTVSWYTNSLIDTILTKEIGEFTQVSVGLDKLSTQINQRKTGVFPILLYGDERGGSRGVNNHFVSLHVSDDGKTVTYFDSNGELMPKGLEDLISKKYPNASVNYIGKDGNLISQYTAKQNPDQILRTQFDEHNCGVYTTKFCSLMAKGVSVKEIASTLAELNPELERACHAEKAGVQYKAEKSCKSEVETPWVSRVTTQSNNTPPTIGF